jgi:hypothetical protein
MLRSDAIGSIGTATPPSPAAHDGRASSTRSINRSIVGSRINERAARTIDAGKVGNDEERSGVLLCA